MDVQALEIPTYIQTSLQWGILFAECKLQKKHPTSILCSCSRNQFFKCKISGFYQYKSTTYSQNTAVLQYSTAQHFLPQSSLEYISVVESIWGHHCYGVLSYSSLLFYPDVFVLTGLFAGQVRRTDLHWNPPGTGLFPQTNTLSPCATTELQNNRTGRETLTHRQCNDKSSTDQMLTSPA